MKKSVKKIGGGGGGGEISSFIFQVHDFIISTAFKKVQKSSSQTQCFNNEEKNKQKKHSISKTSYFI